MSSNNGTDHEVETLPALSSRSPGNAKRAGLKPSLLACTAVLLASSSGLDMQAIMVRAVLKLDQRFALVSSARVLP